MRKAYLSSLVLLITVIFSALTLAEDESKRDFLLGVSLKAWRLREEAIAEIRKIDAEIMKNEATMQKSQQIINLASQRSDAKAKEAEKIARQSLIIAQEAKKKNEDIKRHWMLKKIRAERAYATIKNMLAEGAWGLRSEQPIQGFVANFSGKVEVINPNGNRYFLLDPESPTFLKAGDVIKTGEKGKVTFNALGGRGDITLGPNSELVVEKTIAEGEEVSLIKGKLYGMINKIDDYANKINKTYEEYKQDMKTILRMDKEDLKELLKMINREYKVRTPVAGIAVRATEFSIEYKGDGQGELIVLEGVVEISNQERKQKISVEGGQRVIFSKDGISSPQKNEKIEKWWGD